MTSGKGKLHLVLGKPGAQWMVSGAAKAPICLRTCAMRDFLVSSVAPLALPSSVSVMYA